MILTNKPPLKFFSLVFAISIPFWILGALTEQLSKILPINLPISALMFVCPITAALILVYKENKLNGVKQLLGRVFDYQRIQNKIWYIPIIFFMPVVMVLSFWLMRLLRLPLPEPNIPFAAIPIFFCFIFHWRNMRRDRLDRIYYRPITRTAERINRKHHFGSNLGNMARYTLVSRTSQS